MNISNCIKIVKKFLKDNYGEVKPEWELSLELLKDALDLREQLRTTLRNSGLTQVNPSSGNTSVNPLLGALKEQENRIFSILKEYGLTPLSKERLDMANLGNKRLKTSQRKQEIQVKELEAEEAKEDTTGLINSFLNSTSEDEDEY